MSNLFNLLKISFINSTGMNSLSKGIDNSKEKKKLIFTSFMLIFVGVLIVSMATSYSIGIAEVLKPRGYLDLLIVIAVLASSIITFMTSIYKAQGTLFNLKDYDLLMSLPIKNSTILASKLINMMIINYAINLLILIPAASVYYIYDGTLSWIFFVILVIEVLFLAMIPIILSTIIAILITFISSRFKYKNIMTSLVAIIFFVGLMVVGLKGSSYINELLADSESIMNKISRLYPPAIYFKDALIDYDITSLLKFIAVSIIPFVIFVWAFGKSFKSLNGKLSESFKSANYKINNLKTNGVVKAITIAELRKYIGIPIYVLNTMLGMIIVLVAAISSLFISPQTLADLAGYPELVDMIPVMILILFLFSIGISSTTSSSISLEGNRLWIVKSLPIKIVDIFKAKIIMSLIITLPISIISNMIFFIALKFNIKYLVLNLAITIVFAIWVAILGLLINLHFPKMEWTNPTSVVKQSASVLINMSTILVIIALGVGAAALFKVTNFVLFLSIVVIILIVLLLVSWRILVTKGEMKFREL